MLAIVAGLTLTAFTGDLAKLLPLPPVLDDIRYVRSGLSYLVDIAGMVVLLRILGGVAWRQQWGFMGLARAWQPAALMGACIFMPVLFAGLVLGEWNEDLDAASVLFLGILAPFAEEVTYRGLAIGALITVAGWRFWPAALLPALVFGLVHAAQGDGLEQAGLIMAITGVGGIFFGWLYVRFDHNLWPAIFMHIGLNVVWNLFAFGETAIGDAAGNILRAMAVAAAIAFAVWGRGWLHRATTSSHAD